MAWLKAALFTMYNILQRRATIGAEQRTDPCQVVWDDRTPTAVLGIITSRSSSALRGMKVSLPRLSTPHNSPVSKATWMSHGDVGVICSAFISVNVLQKGLGWNLLLCEEG